VSGWIAQQQRDVRRIRNLRKSLVRSRRKQQNIEDAAEAGCRQISKARGFYVNGHPIIPTANVTLREGEIERARARGSELTRLLE
jgi:hypothetical protein